MRLTPRITHHSFCTGSLPAELPRTPKLSKTGPVNGQVTSPVAAPAGDPTSAGKCKLPQTGPVNGPVSDPVAAPVGGPTAVGKRKLSQTGPVNSPVNGPVNGPVAAPVACPTVGTRRQLSQNSPVYCDSGWEACPSPNRHCCAYRTCCAYSNSVREAFGILPCVVRFCHICLLQAVISAWSCTGYFWNCNAKHQLLQVWSPNKHYVVLVVPRAMLCRCQQVVLVCVNSGHVCKFFIYIFTHLSSSCEILVKLCSMMSEISKNIIRICRGLEYLDIRKARIVSQTWACM